MKYDIAIIGGGLAGCCAAYEAHKKGKTILWIDQPEKNISSKVAAGMLNPIVLRRFTKSWKVDTVLPYALEFYKLIDQEIFHSWPIFRIFASENEKTLWDKISQEDTFDQYMTYPNQKINEPQVKDNFGYGLIKNGGYLYVPKFIEKIKKIVTQNTDNLYLETEFKHEELIITDKSCQFKDYHFETTLFCEGPYIHNNPFFNHLPYRRAKGEIIIVKAPGLNIKEGIYSRSVFCLDMGDNIFKIGSTFDNDDHSTEPTAKGRTEILSKFEKFYLGKYEVLDHYAGIRPTVLDRRPLLGKHKTHDNLFLLNGLGTKGVLLAPYFAKAIISFIFDKKQLDPECNISRFDKL